MNDVLDFGVHFLSVGRGRFFKRGGFSTATTSVSCFKHREHESSRRSVLALCGSLFCYHFFYRIYFVKYGRGHSQHSRFHGGIHGRSICQHIRFAPE
jgi:hypothetical protein